MVLQLSNYTMDIVKESSPRTFSQYGYFLEKNILSDELMNECGCLPDNRSMKIILKSIIHTIIMFFSSSSFDYRFYLVIFDLLYFIG